jgi:hypothetical protein
LPFDWNNGFVRQRMIFSFVLGILILVIPIMGISTLLKTKASLTELRGTLEDCESRVSRVTNTHKFVTTESNKAELIFYLHEHRKKFRLAENIGQDASNEFYDWLKLRMESAKELTISISRDETEDFEPTVFQIAADGNVLLDFDTIRLKDRLFTMLLLLLGLIGISLPLYVFRHDIKKIFSRN